MKKLAHILDFHKNTPISSDVDKELRFSFNESEEHYLKMLFLFFSRCSEDISLLHCG